MTRAWAKELQSCISDCTACGRLASYVAGFRERSGYWARPVPAFGDPDARVLVLGLAPGAHGANRTGRPFTGDAAGVLLYRALFEHGFASAAESVHRRDGLILEDVWITNVVKCAPPANKPLGDEISRCAPFLDREMERLARLDTVVVLGRVAHDNMLRWARRRVPEIRMRDHPFVHGKVHRLPQPLPRMLDSFHPSRYNVNVGKLTWPMFSRVFGRLRALLRE